MEVHLGQDPSPSEDFDTAKSVVDKLASLSRDRQERILRWVSESLGMVLSGAPPAGTAFPTQPISTAPASGTVASGTARDIKSFIAGKSPKSDNQFASAVAYYYRFDAPPAVRRDAIDGDLLQEAARQAGWHRFKRPSDTLNNALKAGYLDSAERGTFKLNNVGENLVAMAMPSGSAKATTRKRVGKQKSRNKGTSKAR